MPWNSSWPVGSVSVKSNKVTGQQNTTYIEQTLGKVVVGTNPASLKDHFWAVDSNLDGHHRFMKLPAFTVGSVPAEPAFTTGIDGVIYLSTVSATVSRIEIFYANAQQTYQLSPSFLTGTVVVGASFVTVVAVPANVYGEIFMFTDALGDFSGVTGFFRSDATTVEAWALTNHIEVSGDARTALVFGSGTDASGLNIRAIRDDASSGLTWNYRITYRAI